MGVVSDRRQFLKTALYGTAGVALSPAMLSSTRADVSEPRIEVTDLGGGFQVLHILPDADATLASGAGFNALTLSDNNGRILLDGGLPHQADAVLAMLSELGGGPVHTVFNSNWRPESTGLNVHLGEQGARIIATALTRQWMSRRNYIEWEDKTYERTAAIGLPNDPFYNLTPHNPKYGELQFGNNTAEYGSLIAAYSDGDMYVYFKEANILFTGHTMTVGSYPLSCYVTGGWTHDMRDANEWLMGITNADTRIVARSGPVQTRRDLELQFEMLDVMADRVVDFIRQGQPAVGGGMATGASPAFMLANNITAEFDERWGDPTQFIYNAYWGVMGHARDVLPSFA